MEDNDLMEFIDAYNNAEDKPTTSLEWLLFIDKTGFAIYKKSRP